MRTSAEIDKLSVALAKAHAKFVNPKKNQEATVKGKSKGGVLYEYTYTYTSLDLILDMARPILAEVECYVTQGVTGDLPPYKLVTRITHSSGQWQETDTPLPYSGSTDPQELGMALSYSRRYGIGPAIGIASEEDKDAGGKKGNQKKGAPAEGVGDSLDEPTRNRMTDVATVVQDFAKAGQFDKALTEWEGTDFKDSNEAKIFAWGLLPSPTRSTLKRMQAEARKT